MRLWWDAVEVSPSLLYLRAGAGKSAKTFTRRRPVLPVDDRSLKKTVSCRNPVKRLLRFFQKDSERYGNTTR